jgi:hypothetical protein
VTCCSLGETKGNSRKADKTGTNQLGCLPIATTPCYYRQAAFAEKERALLRARQALAAAKARGLLTRLKP